MLWSGQVTEGMRLAMNIIEVRDRAIKRTAHPQQDTVLHAVFNGHRRYFLWPDRDVGIRARERYTVLYGYLICNSSRGEPPTLSGVPLSFVRSLWYVVRGSRTAHVSQMPRKPLMYSRG